MFNAGSWFAVLSASGFADSFLGSLDPTRAPRKLPALTLARRIHLKFSTPAYLIDEPADPHTSSEGEGEGFLSTL